MFPASVEPWIVSSSHRFVDFSGCLGGRRVEEECGREYFSELAWSNWVFVVVKGFGENLIGDPRDQRLDVQHPCVATLHLLVRREGRFTTASIHECEALVLTKDESER